MSQPPTLSSPQWYILKRPDGPCEILCVADPAELGDRAPGEQWGPFTAEGEAIARRVGLIRAGKCQPL